MLSVKSYAKINLSLKILGVRPDGYHELESIMQNVSLFDEIEFSGINEGIEIICDDPAVPTGRQNICFRAADLLMRKFSIGKGIKIDIKKYIPLEAGLGGGSSNAAATLMALDKMWELNIPKHELLSMGAHIGSDVPFFIAGGRAICRGKGEKINKILNPKPQIPNKSQISNSNDQNKTQYIIVKPEVAVPTKWAYEEWDHGQKASDQRLGTRDWPGTTSPQSLATSPFFNDLEEVVLPHYPQITEVKEELMKAGCSYAQMTGSGSAVFGITDDKLCGEKILKEMKTKYPRSFLTSEVDKGVEIL